MGRPTGSKNKQNGDTEKPWRISALLRDRDLQYAVKYRALDDEISYEDLVIAGIKLYLQTPSKNPNRYLTATQNVLRGQNERVKAAGHASLTDPVDEHVKAAGHASKSH